MERNIRKNQKVLIILLIVLLLLLAVGYAIFSDTLTIQGTANAKGTFDLEFQNAEVVKSQGVNEEETKVEILENKNILKVNVSELAYPGAGAEFSVDIVNVGTIPAKVQTIKQTNINESGSIKVRGLEVINEEHPTIEPEDKCNVHFVVKIPEEAIVIQENENISFSLEIEYTQATAEVFEGNTAHLDEKEKLIPEYTIPTGLTATYGQTLANVKLPEGFSFQDSLETSVGEIGTNIFKVMYTPRDVENYRIVTDIEITIKVEEAKPTLVSQITGEDYGKYINYSTTVKGEIVDNWRVFLNDGENVYIILDDYMPNRLLPEETGLTTYKTYCVYSNVNSDTLLNRLNTESYWKEFAGGAEGALATGGPTNEQFVTSWNENPEVNARKIKTNTFYFTRYGLNGGDLSDPTRLYVTHTSQIDNCGGYWMLWRRNYAGVDFGYVWYDGRLFVTAYNAYDLGIRPLVCLPSNITGIVGETVEI